MSYIEEHLQGLLNTLEQQCDAELAVVKEKYERKIEGLKVTLEIVRQQANGALIVPDETNPMLPFDESYPKEGTYSAKVTFAMQRSHKKWVRKMEVSTFLLERDPNLKKATISVTMDRMFDRDELDRQKRKRIPYFSLPQADASTKKEP